MATQSEISRDWQTSRNYVHKCVRKRGCPTTSLKAARDWRDAFARGRPPTDAKQLQLQQENNGPAKTAAHTKCFQKSFDQRRMPSDPLEFALTCVRRAEMLASILLQQAIKAGQDSKIIACLVIYNKALEGRLKVEELCRLEIERRRNLIPAADAMNIARRGFDVAIHRLKALPQNLAHRCDPSDPKRAMVILQAECGAIIADVQRVIALWPGEQLP